VAADAAIQVRPRWVRATAVSLAAALLLVSSAQAAYRLYRLSQQVAELEYQRAALLEENRRLREEIRRLYDPAYVERVAREELGLVRPGEIAVVLVPRPAPTPRRR
jgi:cell division protein FtsL